MRIKTSSVDEYYYDINPKIICSTMASSTKHNNTVDEFANFSMNDEDMKVLEDPSENNIYVLAMQDTARWWPVKGVFMQETNVSNLFLFKFCVVWMITNTIGASEHCDILREVHANKILKALELGELETGSGQNQEMSVKLPGDTRWSSNFHALTNFIAMYSSIMLLLKV